MLASEKPCRSSGRKYSSSPISARRWSITSTPGSPTVNRHPSLEPYPPYKHPQQSRRCHCKSANLVPSLCASGCGSRRSLSTEFDDHLAEPALQEAFPEETIDDLALAIAELATDGFLDTTPVMSNRIPRMCTTTDLYLMFDPHAIGQNPADDAVKLIELVLAKTNTVGVEDLHKESEWPLRRFNPAFACIISRIEDRRVLRGNE